MHSHVRERSPYCRLPHAAPVHRLSGRQEGDSELSPTADKAILVPGTLHPQAVRRIDESFRLVRVDRSDPALVTEEIARSVVGMGAMTTVDAAFIDALPNLQIIANFGVGYDAVDAAYAGSKGIMVTNTPDVLTEEVADTAIGLLVNTVRELCRAEAFLRAGRWVKEGAYPLTPGTLRGRHVGVFGLGRIGRAIARRLEAFGLEVSYHNRSPAGDLPYAYYPTLQSLAEAVDTLIAVVPGSPATDRIVDAGVLHALGPNGVFINIGRGSVVDEGALATALSDGTIMAAGLDVYADEPNVPDALMELENVCLLPHVGSASVDTRRAMADLVADNLVSWFSKGKALTPVAETAHVRH